MNVKETDGTDFNPYLIIGESKSDLVIIRDFGTELAAVAEYERLLKTISESSRSRYETVQLMQVLRHAKVDTIEEKQGRIIP